MDIKENKPLGQLAISSPSDCFGCGASLNSGFFSSGRYCHYTGEFFCASCHHNEKAVIPARMLCKWDSKEYKVSNDAKALIDANYAKPALNVASINPALYEWLPTLKQIKTLRVQLKIMGEFIRTCKDGERLLRYLAGREHLLESVHIYALRDLVDAAKGRLVPFVYKIMEAYILHITQTCECCKGKGHFCELCRREDDLVYPFQLKKAVACKVCKGYFHAQCWQRIAKEHLSCPRCQRIRALRVSKPASSANTQPSSSSAARFSTRGH